MAALKKEAEEERQRAQAEARGRVLKEFERGQLGLGLGGSPVIPKKTEETYTDKKSEGEEECANSISS